MHGQHAVLEKRTPCTVSAPCLRRAPFGAVSAIEDGAPTIVPEVLSSAGRPLDGETRAFMEPRFGHDFGDVRVYTDAQAAESARSVDALAYTVGRQVVFGAGQYAPHTAAGRQLLAHELVHVVQQAGTGSYQIQALRLDSPHSVYEQQAQEAARLVAEGASFEPSGLVDAGLVQRDLATEPPAEAREQPDLTPEKIQTALAFNRTRFTQEQTRLIQDIVGTDPTGIWTEEDILAVAQIQEEYNLEADGIIGLDTLRFIDREQQLEGAPSDDATCLTSFFAQGFPVTFLSTGAGQHRLEGHFQVRAQFPARCDCSAFQYRQFIKGKVVLRRAGVEHDLKGIFNQLPAGELTTDFREDGDTSDVPVNYGHRDQPADTDPEDRYVNDRGNTDQANGCRYRNEDFPGADLNTQSGDVYDATMRFRGEIQRNNRAVRTLEWTAIRGTFRVP